MKQISRVTVPDLIGFSFVGATSGIIALGGIDTGLTAHSALGCVGGALLGPAVCVVPRLFAALTNAVRRKAFFFEKKKQKAFICAVADS